MREPGRQAGERSDPRGLHRRQPAGQTDLCLAQINRALKTISECDQALIRATDETELLNQICRIVVDDGGYRLAWVGFAEDDEAKSVRPVAQHGFEEGYLETVNITWADTERGAVRSAPPSARASHAPCKTSWRIRASCPGATKPASEATLLALACR